MRDQYNEQLEELNERLSMMGEHSAKGVSTAWR